MKKFFSFSNVKEEQRIFSSTSKDKLPCPLLGNSEEMNNSIGFRIPSLLYLKKDSNNKNGVLLAVADKGNDGSDWGAIGISIRRSMDNGNTFEKPLKDIIIPPIRKQPYTDEDWGSAFYIDPVMVETQNGDVVLMADFFPESRGIHSKEYLEEGCGFNSNGELLLTDSKAPCNGGKWGNTFIVKKDGFIYDNNGNKTNYYFPKNHNPLYNYQTFGDIYYTNGDNQYLNNYPPLIPQHPINNSDIFVGNVFLNVDKPDFIKDNPTFVQKEKVTNKYCCIESKPAPLRALVTSHLVIMRSKDQGITFSKPEFITHQVKNKKEKFIGTGPGVGLCLKNQNNNKNGRILMPVYYLGIGYMLISDNNGESFKCTKNDIGVIDEIQAVELSDGRILAFGRQKDTGETPYSISIDSGETFKFIGYTNLISASCQKSFIMYPNNLGLDIILCSHNSKQGRTNGKISVGIIKKDNTIEWKNDYEVKNPPIYSCAEEPDFFGYSCLSVQDKNEIGLLYEPIGRNCISYIKVKLNL